VRCEVACWRSGTLWVHDVSDSAMPCAMPKIAGVWCRGFIHNRKVVDQLRSYWLLVFQQNLTELDFQRKFPVLQLIHSLFIAYWLHHMAGECWCHFLGAHKKALLLALLLEQDASHRWGLRSSRRVDLA
jgi:hypothetical protein